MILTPVYLTGSAKSSQPAYAAPCSISTPNSQETVPHTYSVVKVTSICLALVERDGGQQGNSPFANGMATVIAETFISCSETLTDNFSWPLLFFTAAFQNILDSSISFSSHIVQN